MRDECATTAVLGAVLMLSLMMTLVPGALLLKGALSDEMDAQREAAERAAWCARHPDLGPPACPWRGPLPGYRCDALGADAWLCRPAGDALDLNGTADDPSAGARLMHGERLPVDG